jgi:sigma-B regulation protein RsbU (phosphoserine phosphatase)
MAQGQATQEDDISRLRRAVRELSILNDLARDIGASLDSQHITNTIVKRSLRAIGAEQGVISLVDRRGDGQMQTLVRTVVGPGTGQALHVEESLLGWMQLNKRPLLLNRPREDARFSGVKWDDSIRTLLCVPLLVKSELTGVLILFNKRRTEGFNEDDQRLLSILAAQSAQVVESARLHEEEVTLRRLEDELALASEIQIGLLPESRPVLKGYDIAGKNIPAETIGGDYFDFIRLGGESLAVCVADVSGKGLSASLLMANLQATIRAQALMQLSPGKCLEHSNTLLSRSTDLHKFATCFYAALDPSANVVSYSNAGHDPPLLVRRNGETERLTAGGLVLGFTEGVRYEESVADFKPGDLLIMYSDGITDAEDAQGRPFGEERLQDVVREHAAGPADSIVDGIMAAVRAHSCEHGQTDDMTAVVVKRDCA